MESNYTVTSSGDPAIYAMTMMLVFTFMFLPLLLLVIIPTIVGLWKTFTKAGQPGWAAIIPIYNTVVLLKMIGRPVWWILLLFIPLVSLVVSLAVYIDVARSFGKDLTFGILMWLFPPIGLLILGFSKDVQYVGPVAKDTDMFSGFRDTHQQPVAPTTPPLPSVSPMGEPTVPAPSAPPVAPRSDE